MRCVSRGSVWKRGDEGRLGSGAQHSTGDRRGVETWTGDSGWPGPVLRTEHLTDSGANSASPCSEPRRYRHWQKRANQRQRRAVLSSVYFVYRCDVPVTSHRPAPGQADTVAAVPISDMQTLLVDDEYIAQAGKQLHGPGPEGTHTAGEVIMRSPAENRQEPQQKRRVGDRHPDSEMGQSRAKATPRLSPAGRCSSSGLIAHRVHQSRPALLYSLPEWRRWRPPWQYSEMDS